MRNISWKLLVIAAVALVLGSSSSMARDATAERAKLDSNAAIAKAAAITFTDLAGQRPPAGLTDKQKQGYEEQSIFLRRSAGRLLELQGQAAKVLASRNATVAQMAAMNMQFLALQNAVQNESRKFQTISNASRARHDIAMNAIRNLKG
jgi:hypothetical protein